MTDRIWHKGPPPHVGWWNATSDKTFAPYAFSWWDGKRWSLGSQPHHSAELAASRAMRYRPPGSKPVEWSDYWPENARVPRADPRQPEIKPDDSFDKLVVEMMALELVAQANKRGLNVTVERQSCQPLAMGHMKTVINVWLKRSAP